MGPEKSVVSLSTTNNAYKTCSHIYLGLYRSVCKGFIEPHMLSVADFKVCTVGMYQSRYRRFTLRF